jgi:hypothetical protein
MFDDELKGPHWSQGLGTRDDPTEAAQEAPPGAKKSRVQVDRDAWMASLAAFTYKEWGTAYKFLEHALLRATQRSIPPSHVERLTKLDLTWGSKHQTLAQLLVQPNASIHSANINRKVRLVGDCAFPYYG